MSPVTSLEPHQLASSAIDRRWILQTKGRCRKGRPGELTRGVGGLLLVTFAEVSLDEAPGTSRESATCAIRTSRCRPTRQRWPLPLRTRRGRTVCCGSRAPRANRKGGADSAYRAANKQRDEQQAGLGHRRSVNALEHGVKRRPGFGGGEGDGTSDRSLFPPRRLESGQGVAVPAGRDGLCAVPER